MTSSSGPGDRLGGGLGAAGVARGGLLVVQVATAIAMSRLLAPADFGAFAMVSVFGACAVLLASLGLRPALVHLPELHEGDVRAALALSFAVGGSLGALFVLGAPLLAAFYGQPALIPLARIQGVAILAWTAGDVPRALLARRLAIGVLLRHELWSALAAAAVCLPLAAAGAGAVALATLSLVTGLASTVLAVFAARAPLVPALEPSACRRLLANALPATGLDQLTYWSRNLDNLLIGKLAGEQALGLYSRAFQVMLQPLWQVSGLVSAFLFPILARQQHCPELARATYLAAQRLLATLALPVLIGSMATAGDLVPAVLGDAWMAMVPILELLLLAGVVQVPMMLVGPACAAHGRNALLLRWGLVSGPVTMLALAAGASFRSAEAVAASYLAAQALLCAPTVRLACRTLGLGPRDVARAIAPALAAALAMGLVVAGLEVVLASLPRLERLALCVGAGALAYGLLAARAGLISSARWPLSADGAAIG